MQLYDCATDVFFSNQGVDAKLPTKVQTDASDIVCRIVMHIGVRATTGPKCGIAGLHHAECDNAKHPLSECNVVTPLVRRAAAGPAAQRFDGLHVRCSTILQQRD